MRLTRLLATVVSAWALVETAAFAQPAPSPVKKDTRIPIAVFDARGVLARLGQDATTAAGLSTSVFTLPASGYGGAAGAHVYLLRRPSFALGVGGEAILARASRTLTDSSGKATGAVIHRRLRALSGQLSLNFGRRAGWSYLTAGMGPTSFESYLDGATPDGLRPNSLNFGGGARWFNFKHLAFTADMRFYATKPALATPNTAPRVRRNLIVFSAGIAIQ
ncbi:MAG: hypothetical protein EPO35_07855 [Acidobacteria bacterium]|nr:MAG: hypothetical protein EPO35_07855 [Acidobacteriota bacterium]